VDVREDFCVHHLQNEQTALMYASGGGHLEIVRVLLKAGASVSTVDKNMAREDEGAQTALHYAARQKNLAIIEELLKAGADINALTTRKNTPLNHVIWHNNLDGARFLIQHGANLSCKIGRKQARSPLFAIVDAIRNGVPPEAARDFALFLLEAGAEPNGTGDTNMTAIFLLTLHENIPEEIAAQLLEKLLKAGAKPDWLDKFGAPPLVGAMIRQRPTAVRLLLEYGADVNRISIHGTALDLNEQHTKMFEKELKEFKAQPPPTEPKKAEWHKQGCEYLEDKIRRCKEISEILHKFGAKRKKELPQTENAH